MIIAFMMLHVLPPYRVIRAEDGETGGYGLWVGRTEVTDENKNDILNDGGKAKYDPYFGILTLDNPSLDTGLESAIYSKNRSLIIEGSVNAIGSGYGIRVENGRLTINRGTVYAEGEIAISCRELVINGGKINALSKPNGKSDKGAVKVDSSIAVLGGELNATATGADCFGILSGGDTTIISGNTTVDVNGSDVGFGVRGIRANGTLDIQGGDVKVTANAKASGASSDYAYGLFAGNKIKISDGTVYVNANSDDYAVAVSGNIAVSDNVEISGGNVTVIASGYYAHGFSWTSFALSGGKVQVTSTGDRDSYGIFANGPITISDGELTATCSSNQGEAISADSDVIISGGKISATAYGEGSDAISVFPFLNYAKIEISGGEIHASGKGGEGSAGFITSQPLSITGGTIESNGDTWGIFSEGLLTIGNGIEKVSAEGKKDKAICSENKISLGNELTIKKPDNGKLSSDSKTVVDSKGKISTYALIVNDNKYTVTVRESENGTIVSSRNKANGGDTVALTVSPEENCRLDSLDVKDANGNKVTVRETENGYEFTMPESNVTVSAVFVRYYDVRVSQESAKYVSVDPEKAKAGTTVTVRRNTVSGYVIKEIMVADAGGNRITVAEDDTFVMPASEVAVSVQVAKLYAIIMNDSENGKVVAGKDKAEAGDVVALAVYPEENCKMDTIKVEDADGNDIAVEPAAGGFEFTMPALDVLISAVFIRYYDILIPEESAPFVSIDLKQAAEGQRVAVKRNDVPKYVIKSIIITDQEGKEISLDEDDSFIMPASKVTVTINAVKLFTLTFDLDGGQYNGNPIYIVEHEDQTAIQMPEPKRKGYSFEYWEGSRYYAGDFYTVTEDHVFKAIWSRIPDSPSYIIPETGVE